MCEVALSTAGLMINDQGWHLSAGNIAIWAAPVPIFVHQYGILLLIINYYIKNIFMGKTNIYNTIYDKKRRPHHKRGNRTDYPN